MRDIIETDHQHTHSQTRFGVIPTEQRLGLRSRYRGRNVRIAFLDSGFVAHPDFSSRVIEFHDVSGEDRVLDLIAPPAPHHWHGTQTVTACAGNGTLSDAVYRGLASEAELVLVKVSRQGRIGDFEIEAGLLWVIDNLERLKIRVLNISLGGDSDLPTPDSSINMLVDEITAKGVVVTVAAGNSAGTRSVPPASAASAITVGGYSDRNELMPQDIELYHSSHGPTVDGTVKPELIAPAMFIAAPILPGTPDYRIAETLSLLAALPDYAFAPMLRETWHECGLDADVLDLDLETARSRVEDELWRRKVIATHYQHVDGTSYAAPITASVVALMLEAHPDLTPAAVKNILVSTATRSGNLPAGRQGFGVLDAGAAIKLAEAETHTLDTAELSPPRLADSKVFFRFHDDSAATVELAGDFNGWHPSRLIRCAGGLWETSISHSQPAYRYKFLIDGSKWIEDPTHAFKEEDGFGGFNSVIVIT